MKIRHGFVSNSSSSSFIVFGEKPRCDCVKLTNEQAFKIMKDKLSRGHIDEQRWGITALLLFEGKVDIWLTTFISDCSDVHSEYGGSTFSYDYCEGNHGGPYNSDDYTRLNDGDEYSGVWIRNEHL